MSNHRKINPEDLKSCPFCGGAPKVKVNAGVTGKASKSRYWRSQIFCSKCGGSTKVCSSPEQSTKAWNRRTAATTQLNESEVAA